MEVVAAGGDETGQASSTNTTGQYVAKCTK